MTRSRDLGTQAESAVRDVFIADGFPHCERRALHGAYDKGDLSGLIGICVEVKGGRSAELASDGQVVAWMTETEVERQNSGSDYGLLVMKRSGYGPARAADWWCVVPAWQFLSLLGIPQHPLTGSAPVRLHLATAIRLLRLAGYGDQIDKDIAA